MVEEKQKQEAMNRVKEAYEVFDHIMDEMERGKCHPVDGLAQMMNEFSPAEKRKWTKIFRERF